MFTFVFVYIVANVENLNLPIHQYFYVTGLSLSLSEAHLSYKLIVNYVLTSGVSKAKDSAFLLGMVIPGSDLTVMSTNSTRKFRKWKIHNKSMRQSPPPINC
jgi:hypothetical protein